MTRTHHATATEANVQCEGSATIDRDLLGPAHRVASSSTARPVSGNDALPVLDHAKKGALAVALAATLALGLTGDATAQLRPIVRDMLENLGSVNRIGQALALEDYAGVESAAQDLKRRAAALKEVDLATLGLEVDRNDRFDAYLAQQEEAADGIVSASRDKDSRGVLLGVQQLLQNACLSCHADFRQGRSALRQSVLFMTTFLSAWEEINRGLAVDDYTLVSRGARELQAVSRVLSWDQVIDSAFATHEPAERKVFRGLLLKMAKHAAEIERAAEQQETLAILSNSRLMWEACIACHDRFRKP